MIIANLLGIVIFFVLLWKNLKDDYHYEKIFNLSFITLGILLLFNLIAIKLLPNYTFWMQFMGLSVGFGLGIYLQKIKFYESFNAVAVSILPWFSLNYLNQAITNSNLIEFIIFWLGLFLIFIFFLTESFYRKFIWYKSGRVGFSGLLVAGIFFTLQLFFLSSLVERLISTAVAFGFFLLLYKLSISKE